MILFILHSLSFLMIVQFFFFYLVFFVCCCRNGRLKGVGAGHLLLESIVVREKEEVTLIRFFCLQFVAQCAPTGCMCVLNILLGDNLQIVVVKDLAATHLIDHVREIAPTLGAEGKDLARHIQGIHTEGAGSARCQLLVVTTIKQIGMSY